MGKHAEYVGLQYLRGLAAAGVVVDHVSGMTALPKYFGRSILGGALEHGAIGVDLFFLVSGFIISTVSLDGGLAPSLGRGQFFLRRAERILPLMWLAIVSYAAMRLVIHAPFAPAEYLRATLLLPWGAVEPNNIWTLRHEFVFYVLFAATFISSRRWLRLVALVWIAAPFAYSALALPREPATAWLQFVRIIAHPVNVEFGAGLLAGLAWKAWAPARSLRLSLDPALILAACFCGLVAAGAAFSLTFQSVWCTTMTALLCAPILLLAVAAECPPSLIGRVARVLGDASYSIYLFHVHAISICLVVLTRVAPHASIWLVVPLISAVAVGAGVAVHFMIERPMQRGVRAALRPRGAPVLSPT